MARYLTVVIEVNDEEVFKRDVPDLHARMLAAEGSSWRVTAMALDDEITRLDLLEQASRVDDALLVMGDIFGATGISDKTLDDFIEG